MSVARASLEELLVDYQDFRRQRNLELWPKDLDKAVYVRRLAHAAERNYDTYQIHIEEKSPQTAANTMICLICQSTYLLVRLKRELANRLVEEGGITERLYHRRKAKRNL